MTAAAAALRERAAAAARLGRARRPSCTCSPRLSRRRTGLHHARPHTRRARSPVRRSPISASSLTHTHLLDDRRRLASYRRGHGRVRRSPSARGTRGVAPGRVRLPDIVPDRAGSRRIAPGSRWARARAVALAAAAGSASLLQLVQGGCTFPRHSAHQPFGRAAATPPWQRRRRPDRRAQPPSAGDAALHAPATPAQTSLCCAARRCSAATNR